MTDAPLIDRIDQPIVADLFWVLERDESCLPMATTSNASQHDGGQRRRAVSCCKSVRWG